MIRGSLQEEAMPQKNDQKTGIKEAQRKALQQKAYEKSQQPTVTKAKGIGKLGSVKAQRGVARGK
jgi:hypothetical protein